MTEECKACHGTGVQGNCVLKCLECHGTGAWQRTYLCAVPANSLVTTPMYIAPPATTTSPLPRNYPYNLGWTVDSSGQPVSDWLCSIDLSKCKSELSQPDKCSTTTPHAHQ